MIALDNITSLYSVPDPLVSEAAYDRFYQFDVPTLSVDDLRRELTVLEVINFIGGDEWHQERESVVRVELEGRGRA